MIRLFLGGLLTLSFVSAGLCHAAPPPKGTSFIGFREGQWNLYLVQEENSPARLVKTVSEPRAATFNLKKSAVAYIAADGKVREVNLKNSEDLVLLEPEKKRAFAQPAYDADGSRLLLVDMRDGTSTDTEIALLDTANPKVVKPLTSQPASQFEPRFSTGKIVVYSSVSCVLGCGAIIQEIWQKNIVTETAEQLTLLNAISRQPVTTPDGKWLYFSSNKGGNYHIWRMPQPGGEPEQVTKGNVTDVNPSVAHDNRICFIRTVSSGSSMVCKFPDGEEHDVDLPGGIQNIRNLEISGW